MNIRVNYFLVYGSIVINSNDEHEFLSLLPANTIYSIEPTYQKGIIRIVKR
jgi:hypothetical protein